MPKRVLIAIAVLMMIIITALVLWLTVWMPCGPNTCTAAGWVYDFQTLLAGIFAFVGGLTVLAAVGIELWDRGNALERTRQEFRHAAVGDVIHRCAELQAMLDNFKQASTPDGEPADMVKYLQEVLAPVAQSSIARTRAAMLDAQKAAATLQTDDYLQWRLSLVAVEGATLDVEIFVQEVLRIDLEPSELLGGVTEQIPSLLAKLDRAKAKIPSTENPKPHGDLSKPAQVS